MNNIVKWFRLLFAVMIVFVIIVGCDERESAGPESFPASKQADSKSSKQKAYSIGENINLQDRIQLTVTNVEKSRGNEQSKPRGGNEYITVGVKLENIGDNGFRYNAYSFALVDSKGNTFEEDVMATIDMDTYLGEGNLQPGETVTGTITFQRPIRETGLQLQFTSGFADLQNPRINLP
jgi:hypothetical protein